MAAQLASHPSYTVLFFRKNKINLTSVLKFQSFQWASEFPSYLSKSKLPSKVISYSQAKGKNKQRNGNRKWGQRNLFDNDRAWAQNLFDPFPLLCIQIGSGMTSQWNAQISIEIGPGQELHDNRTQSKRAGSGSTSNKKKGPLKRMVLKIQSQSGTQN